LNSVEPMLTGSRAGSLALFTAHVGHNRYATKAIDAAASAPPATIGSKWLRQSLLVVRTNVWADVMRVMSTRIEGQTNHRGICHGAT
jgi:hypothetical protein